MGSYPLPKAAMGGVGITQIYEMYVFLEHFGTLNLTKLDFTYFASYRSCSCQIGIPTFHRPPFLVIYTSQDPVGFHHNEYTRNTTYSELTSPPFHRRKSNYLCDPANPQHMPPGVPSNTDGSPYMSPNRLTKEKAASSSKQM